MLCLVLSRLQDSAARNAQERKEIWFCAILAVDKQEEDGWGCS